VKESNIFDQINSIIRNVEGSIVNLLSGIVPWFAPIPAAYMSYVHMTKLLEFPSLVAGPVAAVIEVLGFATVSTILSFWSYNKRYSDEKKQAPVGLVVFAFVFYLGIVLVMNVIIEATVGTEMFKGAVIVVRALLTLMSIPAALVLAVRTQHQEVLNDGEEQKRVRAFKKQYGDRWFEVMYGAKPESGNFPKLSETFNSSWRTARKSMSEEDVQFIATAPVADIMTKFGIRVERTAYNWQEYAKRELS